MPAHLGGWTGIILLIIVIVLFAAPKLPQIAKSVAQSMNVFKKEIKANSDSDTGDSGADDSVAGASGASGRADDSVSSTSDEKNQKN